MDRETVKLTNEHLSLVEVAKDSMFLLSSFGFQSQNFVLLISVAIKRAGGWTAGSSEASTQTVDVQKANYKQKKNFAYHSRNIIFTKKKFFLMVYFKKYKFYSKLQKNVYTLFFALCIQVFKMNLKQIVLFWILQKNYTSIIIRILPTSFSCFF